MAKSWVAPLKPVTIPRLELTAALVSVKTGAILCHELEYDQISILEVFLTDSKVVIGYVSNNACRFYVFVANWVQQIQDHTSPSQWKYVETDQNPADDASCGLYAHNLIESKHWWNGPEFLWKPLENQSFRDDTDPTEILPEWSRSEDLCHSHTELRVLFHSECLRCFSTWHRVKRAVAICLCLQKRYKGTGSDEQGQLKSGDSHTDVAKEKPMAQAWKSTEPRAACYLPVNTQDLQEAKTEIIRSFQREEFQDKISLLHHIGAQVLQDHTQLRTTKKARSRYKMDPFLDKERILSIKVVLFIPCSEAWQKTRVPHWGARSDEWQKEKTMNIELFFGNLIDRFPVCGIVNTPSKIP